MFYNIFRKNVTKEIRDIPLITADIHEKNSLILAELHSSKEVNLEIKPLKIADYLIGNIAIERKTISDLISSMINKRLIQQLSNIKKYDKSLLIVEGNIDELYIKNDKLAKVLRGLVVSIITNHNIPIIFSKDYKDTSQYIITLAKQQKIKQPVSFHSRIPKTLEEQKKNILESFPRIGPNKSVKLLKKFGTLEKIFNTSEEELKEILKNKAGEFKIILSS